MRKIILQILIQSVRKYQPRGCRCGFGAGAVLVRVKISWCGFVSAGAGKFFGAANNINDL